MLFQGEKCREFYVQQLVCRFKERLDVPAFEEAWQRMLERHAVFRLALSRDLPNQWRIHAAVRLPFEVLDWRETGNPQNRLGSWLKEDRRAGIDPRDAPLLRLRLFRLADDDFFFVWTSHHAILDGRSRQTVLNELFAFYDALRCGREPVLPEPVPFQNFLRWMDGRVPDGAEAFWRERFAGMEEPAPLDWALAAGEPGEDTYGIRRWRIEPRLTAALRALCHENGVTLNTLLQGAWAILLGRYSRRGEAVFGATRACRSGGCPGADAMTGLLINTVPLRVALPPAQPLAQWLQTLREQWVAVRPYEQTPLEKIQAWSGVEPGTPLFESLVMFERYQLDSVLRSRGGAWRNRSFEVRGITNIPLVISGYDDGESLLLEFVHHRRRLDDATVSRLAGHLEALLEQMAARPGAALEEFSILTPEEERRIVHEWNATAAEYPQSSIPEVFAAEALKRPGALAVVCGGDRLTYGELDERAAAVARCLRERGVERNVPVGICMERSVEMIVGLLGILKAGGAYVPLEPAWPGERIAGLIAEAGLRLTLTHRAAAHRLPAGAPAVCVDAPAPEGSPRDAADLPRGSAEDIAYIMFTSGSTGRPKGVRIRHRGVVRLVKAANYCRFSHEDVFFQFAPLAFDASTFEIWGALLNGGTLVVAPPGTPSLDDLGRWIEESGATTLWLTASLFQQMAAGSARWFRGVRQLIAGGDRLPVRHAREFLSKNPACRLINGYGPTENTTFTCYYPILSIDRDLESVPIGRPVSNSQVYLLDERMRPVPVGVPGELYIGGDGLAAGYLHEPPGTASRFVSNPFDAAPGARLYRSGDLGRYLPGGEIEFLGRCDNQVKIRGFRIEPGEVEERLLRHGAVRQAAVAVRTHRNGEKYLAAYLVCGGGERPSAGDLRELLERSLPEAMIPWSFTFLEALPLNANGKVDRAKLPAPNTPPPGSREALREPRTPVEAELARIWRDVLELDGAGIRESFFNVGGSSLSAMRMIAEVRRSFGVDLPMSAFLSAPTIERLAERIDALSAAGGPLFPATKAARPGRIPVSLEQEKALRLMRSAPGAAIENIIRILRLRGPLDAQALEAGFNRLIERHEALRTHFGRADSGEYYQIISDKIEIRLPVTDLSGCPEAEARERAREAANEEVQTRFNLAEAPLLRLRLLRLGPENHVLVLAVSHLACDGWSLGVLLTELASVYSALVQKREPELPALTVQHADFAIWERAQLREPALRELEEFWRPKLSGIISPLRLRSAFPRPPLPHTEAATFLARSAAVGLPEEKAASFRRAASAEGVSPFMFFCAVFALLLREESGHPDILIDVPVARRTQPQIRHAMGWFAKTSPVRLNLGGISSFRKLLALVKTTLLEAIAHGLYPSWEMKRLAGAAGNPKPLPQFDLVEVPHIDLDGLFHGLETDFMPLDTVNTDWDLRIQLEWEARGGLIVRLHYRPDLFSCEAAEALLGRFLGLADEALRSPESLLSQSEGEP